MSALPHPNRAVPGPPPDTQPRRFATLGAVIEQLGGVPAYRVRMQPAPGTATEYDLRVPANDTYRCELVLGTLVAKGGPRRPWCPGSPPDAQDLLDRLCGVPPHRVRLWPPPGFATEADLGAANKGCELVAGVLVEKPMGLPESTLAGIFVELLRAFARQHRLGVVSLPDGQYRMSGGNVRLPDVGFTRRERLPRGRPQVGGWCPDLCVEVLSPDNTAVEMAAKREEYFGSGCRLVWEVDPADRTVWVYTSATAPEARLGADAALDGGEVLPGFTLPLAELWDTWDAEWAM